MIAPDHRNLRLPLALASVLLGVALFMSLALNAQRVALAVVVLSITIIIAVLRDMISGDR